MKFIKKFESLSPQSRYIKNRFILFSKKHLKIDFVKEILNQYDVKFIDIYNDTSSYIIECGELSILKSIIEDYPEFFKSFSKIDVNFEEAHEKCESISNEIQSLQDSLGHVDKFGNMKFPDNWNQNIDNIIEMMKSIKI